MSFFEPYLHTPSAVLSSGFRLVPLWAVTQLSIESAYFVPQIDGTRRRIAVVSHDDTISLSAVLLGPLRFAWKVALESLAETSRTTSGLVLTTTATIRTDLAVLSLGFAQSAQRRDALDVTLKMLHLPRPDSRAKLLDVAAIGVGALTDALPF
ncbi:hypothetical protein [Actinophytocola sp.]|uniref:hypothetical protein n=1 Tax=Actinophytocola sp. TaxID=1872138 RepID=UPI002D7E7FF6|nr:hypothetical protein [Actinophytocola sp.]HET9141622.1 hypothetical protein [Actinophytocola sp.]HEU5111327.1 hypothetical protein [Micromonosporaceae bacterium]